MDETDKPLGSAARPGTMAAVAGMVLCLSVPFTPAAFAKNQSDDLVNGSVDIQLSMRWIQPILGQAIMEDTLARQQYEAGIGEAGGTAGQIMTTAPHRNGRNLPAPAVIAYAEETEVDHMARVQWVMGRLIVNLTSHQVQAGLSAADRLANEGNHRIVAIAQQTGTKWDDAFKTRRQNKPGRAVVTRMNAMVQAPAAEQSWGESDRPSDGR